jgi:hypothetical protein
MSTNMHPSNDKTPEPPPKKLDYSSFELALASLDKAVQRAAGVPEDEVS